MSSSAQSGFGTSGALRPQRDRGSATEARPDGGADAVEGKPLNRPTLALAALAVAMAVAITSDAWADIYRAGVVDEETSYVLLAPIVIGWLAWSRRSELSRCRLRGGWLGVLVLLLGWGTFWYGYTADPFFWRAGAVVLAIGAFLAFAGRDIIWKFAPAFAACVFLIPVLPNGRYRFALPLQEATAGATQTVCDLFGMYVNRSGNLLSINGVDVTVAEACNGMRMVLTLFMVCYVVAFTMQLRWWVRILLIAASPLVAIIANVTRLVPTVWMFGNRSAAAAEQFHDVSGWAMTLLAFLLLMGFARLLERATSSANDGSTPTPAAAGQGVA